MAEIALRLQSDVFPALAAFQAARGYGTISIHFENGMPKQVDVDEKVREPEQLRDWVRRFTRSRPAK